MVFYAAVHAVNAYLWEFRRHEPPNHGDRRISIRSTLPLRGCHRSYRSLEEAGFDARYNEKFSLTELGARELLEVDFRQVEATVMQALGQPTPVW